MNETTCSWLDELVGLSVTIDLYVRGAINKADVVNRLTELIQSGRVPKGDMTTLRMFLIHRGAPELTHVLNSVTPN